MMDARVDISSLRLGNYFKEEITGTLIKVIGLKQSEVLFSGNFKGDWQAQPLKVSSDLLMLSGFQKTYEPDSPEWRISLGLGNGEELFVEYPQHEVVSVGVKRSKPLLKDAREDFVYFNDIEFYHQLQNIFYDLTGRHLILKVKDIPMGYGVKTSQEE